MRNQVQQLVTQTGFCPKLREDLKFYRTNHPGLLSVHIEGSARTYQLAESECRIVRFMNGTRDLDAIYEAARAQVPTVTRDEIVKLAIQIAGMGFLANLPQSSPRLELIEGGSRRPIMPPALVKAPLDYFDDDDDDEDYDDTMVDPSLIADVTGATSANTRPIGLTTPSSAGSVSTESLMQNSQPAPPPVPFAVTQQAPTYEPPAAPVSQPPAAPPPAFAPVALPPGATPVAPGGVALPPGATPVAPGGVALPPGAVPVELPPGATPVGEVARSTPLPAPAPAAPAPATPTATPASSSDDDDWEVEKLPWRKRRGPKWLIRLGVVAAILAVLSVVQYPLYVTESAVVRPKAQIVVRAPVEGSIAEVLVDEGDQVTAGMPLVRLDERDLSHELRRAEADFDRLSANVEKMKSGSRPEEVHRARALVSEKAQGAAFARKELNRVRRLHRSGDISESALDEARRDYKTRLAALGQARAELKLVQAGFREEEVKIAEANLRTAKADVDYYTKQLSLLEIKSPIDGKVLTPRFKERIHEKVNRGDEIVEIGDARIVRVEIMVPEREADIVEIGQPVRLKVRSFPTRPFDGEVSFIAPAVEEKEGQRYIRVDAIIDNKDEVLQPRMTGYAEINTGERSVLDRISRRAIRWIRVRFLI